MDFSIKPELTEVKPMPNPRSLPSLRSILGDILIPSSSNTTSSSKTLHSGFISVPNPHKNKTKRSQPTRYQLKVLNETFLRTKYPDTQLRLQLSNQLYMSLRVIQVWFQNRRQNLKESLEFKAKDSLKS